MTENIVISLIGAGVSLGSGVLVIVNTVLTARIKVQGEENARHIANTHAAIQELEQNTNSIKDALVEVTGKAEFERGLKVGRDSHIGPKGPQGERGPQGEQGPEGHPL